MEYTACPHCQHQLEDAEVSFCPACGQPLDIPSSLQDGRYELKRCLGKGGMGMVFLAADNRLRAERAIKLMRLPDGLTSSQAEGLRNRLIQEAQAAQALAERTHHVVRVFDVGIHDEDPYLVMEYLKGVTLADVIARGHLNISYACTLALQVIEALRTAHDQGMVHRDLKPDNIMVVQRDGADFCKLLDFGLVKTNDSLVNTQTGVVMGTLSYMAPEQIRGEAVGAAADIFAFGGVFYEMLTGIRSNPGKTQSELLAVLLDQGALPIETHNPNLSPTLIQLVNRCLHLDADKRPSAHQIQAALKNESNNSGALDVTLAHDSTPDSDVSTEPEPPPKAPSSRLWLYAGVPLLCALGIAFFVHSMDGSTTSGQEDTIQEESLTARSADSPALSSDAGGVVESTVDGSVEVVQGSESNLPDMAIPTGREVSPLPTILPKNPDVLVHKDPDGSISVKEGATADVMGGLARWLVLGQFTSERRKLEWSVLNDEVREKMATVLGQTRGEWSAPIQLKPEEQNALKKLLPTARTLRGLGTLWNDGQAALFWGRVTCSQLQPIDRLVKANWRNDYSDPKYCKETKCIGLLKQAVSNARDEKVRVGMTVQRLDRQGKHATKKVRCTIARQRRR